MARRITARISVRNRVDGEPDRHGNPRYAYTEPFAVAVWVVAPRTAEEPRADGRPSATLTGWDIYAPLRTPALAARPGTPFADLPLRDATEISPYARVELPTGQQGEIIGYPRVWADNPHTGRHEHEGVHIAAEVRTG